MVAKHSLKELFEYGVKNSQNVDQSLVVVTGVLFIVGYHIVLLLRRM